MTPAHLRALQSAIQSDPECMALAVMPALGKVEGGAYAQDKAIATILNGKGYGTSSRAVSCHLAKKLLIKRGKWRAIVRASEDDEHAAVEAAYAAVALAEDARMDADFNDAAAGPLLAALVVSGLLDDTDSAALRAMCRVPSNVTADQVSLALRGPWGDGKDFDGNPLENE